MMNGMMGLYIANAILLLVCLCISVAQLIINERRRRELEAWERNIKNIDKRITEANVAIMAAMGKERANLHDLAVVLHRLAELDSVKEYNFGIADLEALAREHGIDLYGEVSGDDK